jgi:fructose-bisphosphate aldolase class II
LQREAAKNHFAVGAFNTGNLEITKAILAAAEAEKAPIIIAVTPSTIKYAGIKYISAIVQTAIKSSSLPISLHLDHGTDFETVELCMNAGFSSVMIDGSKHPLDENIHITKTVIDAVHRRGISVEGELGRILGAEDLIVVSKREASMTPPDEAAKFVKETKVDALAVSIGNAHGWYKEEPKLDFERLAAIREVTKVPLVLHGASGIPGDDIKKAIDIGITKINIDTEIRDAFKRGVQGFLNENPDEIDPRKILKPAIDEMIEVVRRKIRLFGASDKAKLYK